MSKITVIGFSLLIIYGLVKIFDFYGFETSAYGSYLSFYIFILISSLVLPRYYVSVKPTPISNI
jgi:hypothetical protein